MMQPIQLIIPAAGAGSRFSKIGVTEPKPLIDVAGLPMILWVLGNFRLSDEDRVLIVCQKTHDIPLLLSQHKGLINFSLDYVEIDGLTTGPASTVLLGRDWIDPNMPILVANSDQYVSQGIEVFLTSVRCAEFDGTILTMEATGTKWSYVERNNDGEILRVVEKVEVSNEATVGIYAWSNGSLLIEGIEDLVKTNLRVNNEFYIAPTYDYLVKKGLTIGTFSVGDHGDSVHGLGTPDDLARFEAQRSLETFRSQVLRNLRES